MSIEPLHRDRVSRAGALDVRGRPFSVVRRRGFWRDALRRRLLALADALAVIAASISLGVFTQGATTSQLGLWSAVFVPAWLVFAKLYGLYDRDHSALRHLTVDELPSIFFWALTATAGTALLLHATPAGGPSFMQSVRFWIATAVAAFVFRALARFGWRRITSPERILILGEGPLADATCRKLELFPDIHASAVDDPGHGFRELLTDPERLVGLLVDRILVATHSINEELIAALVATCRRNG